MPKSFVLACGCRLGIDGHFCATATFLQERSAKLALEAAARDPFAPGKKRRIDAELHEHLYSPRAIVERVEELTRESVGS